MRDADMYEHIRMYFLWCQKEYERRLSSYPNQYEIYKQLPQFLKEDGGRLVAYQMATYGQTIFLPQPQAV